MISSLVLSTYLFSTTTYVDFAAFHEKLIHDDFRPGLMGANTALCFFILSIGLVTALRQPLSIFRIRLMKMAAAIIFMIGFIGLVGYIFNLRELYSWIGAARMALHTSVGMELLAIALYIDTLNNKRQLNEDSDLGESITTIVFFTLFISGICIATVAFGFLQSRAVEVIKEDYFQQVNERAVFFKEVIKHRSKRANVLIANDLLTNTAKKILSSEPVPSEVLQQLTTLAIDNEFSAIYLLSNGNVRTPIYIDEKQSQKDIEIPLRGSGNRFLEWHDGFILKSIFPLDEGGSEIKIVFEQPLEALNKFTYDWVWSGLSHNQRVCAKNELSTICFPDRYHQQPFTLVNKSLQLIAPVEMGINQQSGTKRYFNEEGKQVISSYTPIGDTGLGMSLEIAVSEIYSPIIKSFFITILFTILVLAIGFFMIRSRVQPLLDKLSSARKVAETERNRFIAATEGGLDNFYIFEAIRDTDNQIVDFKFIYLNTAAAKLINKTPDEMLGKKLFEELPFTKDRKYFSRFKYVIETGQTIAEEIQVSEAEVNANWIYWQLVKLGDGFSITSRDVTDQHRMMESLAASKERIQQILANQNVATFILDSEHRVTHWNIACEKLTGFPAKRMIGSKESWRGFYDAARPCLADLVLDGNRDEAGIYYEKQGPSALLKSGWHAEGWFENLGGKRRYVIFDAAPIFDANGKAIAAIETLQDVTNAKLVEQALAIEKQNLDSVIEGTEAGTWQWNVRTGELKFNHQWAEMLGYKQSNIGDSVIKTWHALIHPDDFELVQQIKSQHLTGELDLFEAEYRMQHRQGHWVWIASLGRVMTRTDQDEPEWMFGTNMDITARKQADEELKKAYANLEEFTAIASHDLKSPLRGIGDLMEWIEEDLGDDIPDEVKNNLQRVQLRVKRMGSLINDLLAYSRAGVVSDDEATVNVNEMLHEIVELQHISDKFKVNIACKVKPFRTNETPLKTIIRNLVSNAVKHHDKETGEINIDVKMKGDFYIFEVMDDGPGIPDSVKERVFKLFQTLAKNTDSSGVGLAVSKRMAEAHGGHLELESNVEKRVTIFRLFWPKSAHRKLQNDE